uniref:Major facilitator superfamily (MFS) profile domain-containing protein n=1 Tax=Ciona intestinalis TaxID=7719 RepID=H2XXG9_CIOIN
MIDFDIILKHIGGLGRFQIILIFLVGYYSIPAGINSLAPVFINYTPAFRCSVPQFDTNPYYTNLTENEILNLTTPLDKNGEYDTCYRQRNKRVFHSSFCAKVTKIYDYNASYCIEGSLDCVNKSAAKIPCDQGYHYDRSIFPETVITEFDLVCDNKYLDALATSLYMIGVLLGSLIFGNISDRFGRKITMIVTSVLCFAGLLGCAFVHNFTLFVVSRVFVAFFGFGTFISNFVYLLEITSNKWRTLLGVSFQLGFAIGYMILSGVAYQWSNWHDMEIAMSIVSVPYALFLFFIPESPRWLFSNGREEEAKKITRRFAKYNKVTLDEPDIWNEADTDTSQVSDVTRDVISDNKLYHEYNITFIKKTKKRLLPRFVNSMVYYGISLNAGALAGDIFVNNALNGVMEIAAYVIVIAFMDITGRRFMLTAMLVLASASLICSTIKYILNSVYYITGLITLGVVFAFAAKVGISGSYAVVYNFTSELYPTVVRNRTNGVGVGSTFARFGSILAPFILALQAYLKWLPNVIFGVAAAAAALLSYTLPETKGIDMMETIEEAERFYNGKTIKNQLVLTEKNDVGYEYTNGQFDHKESIAK